MADTIKLQTFMAHAGVASRRKSEEMIEKKQVEVNGKKASIGQRIDPTTDQVTIKGKPISNQQEQLRYFLVYKPVGYVSTTSDDQGRKTVLKLLPKIDERVYPVGRLDIDSEGLMLVTNDGDLAYKMTHPKFEVPKTYQVTVKGQPSGKALNHLRRGVKLSEGYTQPAEVEVIDSDNSATTLEITIHEGFNRQVRRMLERVGYDTIKLVRVRFGNYSIDDLGDQEVVEIKKPSQVNDGSTTSDR